MRRIELVEAAREAREKKKSKWSAIIILAGAAAAFATACFVVGPARGESLFEATVCTRVTILETLRDNLESGASVHWFAHKSGVCIITLARNRDCSSGAQDGYLRTINGLTKQIIVATETPCIGPIRSFAYGKPVSSREVAQLEMNLLLERF